MKVKVFQFFLLSTILLSCDSEMSEAELLASQLQGKWRWVESSNTYATRTPESTGKEYEMVFNKDNVSLYRNDTIQFQCKFTIEKRPYEGYGDMTTILSIIQLDSNDVLTDPIGVFFTFAPELKNDTLYMRPECHGATGGLCTDSIFEREM